MPVLEWPDDEESQDAQVPSPDEPMGVPTPTGPERAPAPSHHRPEPTNSDLLNAISALGANLGGRLNSVEEAINTHSGQLGELQRRAERQEGTTAALLRRVEAIEARPTPTPTSSAPSSQTSAGTATLHSSRDLFAVDATIVRINTPTIVSGKAVWDIMQRYIAKAGVPQTSTSFVGPTTDDRLAKRFVLRCTDASQAAAQHAKDIVSALRRPDGTYDHPTIHAPTGADIQVYIALDESIAAISRKRTTKSVFRAIEQMGKADGVSAAPPDGIIAKDWSALVEIRYDAARRQPAISWHDEAICDANIDPDALRSAVAADAANAARGPHRG